MPAKASLPFRTVTRKLREPGDVITIDYFGETALDFDREKKFVEWAEQLYDLIDKEMFVTKITVGPAPHTYGERADEKVSERERT